MVSSPFLLALIPLATGQIIAMGLLESGIHAKATQLSQAPNRDTKKPQPLFVEEHIVAGTKAEPTEFPWIVKSASPASVCTAALIHEDIVLTAAHCQGVFFDGMFISAYNFSSSIEDNIYREVELQVRHKGYNQNISVIVDDLMVIKLSEPVTEIQPVALNRDPDLPTSYEKLYAAGFGLMSYFQGAPSELQKVDLHYIPPDICGNYYRNFENVDSGPGLLCAASRDRAKSVCHAGGPLVTEDKRTLVGITSFGALCETTLAPNGFSRISHYYDWIQEQICELSANPQSSCPPSDPETNPEAVAMNITLQHDFFSWETTWSVRDRSDNSIQAAGPINNPSPYSLWFTAISLLPGEYTFELYDMGGNGMAAFSDDAPFTLGWFELSIATADAKEILIPQTNANFTTVMLSNFVVPKKKAEGLSLSPAPLSFPSGMPSTSSLSQTTSSLRSDQDWTALQATTDTETTSSGNRHTLYGTSLFLAFSLSM